MVLTIHERFALFLLACIPARLSISLVSHAYGPSNKIVAIVLGVLAMTIGGSMLIHFFFNTRPTGPEAGGKIWWHNIRPIHAILYLVFAGMSFAQQDKAWVIPAADAALGLTAFTIYHAFLTKDI